MHDCRETKEQITELLLDGADRQPDETLSRELRQCAPCRNEFAGLKATLRLTANARELSTPSEDYWTGYHAKLRHKLLNINAVSDSYQLSLVERFFRFSIPVPAPVALALIVVFAVLVPVAIRGTRRQPVAIPSVVHVPINVPVIEEKEKIVTRIVYREKQPRARRSKQLNTAAKVEDTFAKSRDTNIPPSLAGFKPTDEVRLKVIKGGSTNEK